MHSDVAVIIPSRLGSERLSQKPLQLIGDIPMIQHVVDSIKLTGLKNIYVATDSELIADKVKERSVEFIMTSEHCTSGTDRVFEAFGKIKDNDNINYVVNVQGDMPFIKPEAILNVIESLKNSYYGITTPVAKVNMGVAEGDSNVKAVITHDGRALYFSRSLIPYGAKEFLYHVGVYGFRKDVLSTFVGLPQSVLEKSERLEQLRALENGIDIGVCYVNDIPISVDTPEDLAKAIEFYHQYIKK